MMAQNPQQQKQLKKPPDTLRTKVANARSRLLLRGLNVTAAVSAAKKLGVLSAKNPRMQYYQLLQRLGLQQRNSYGELTNNIPQNLLDPNVKLSGFNTVLQRLAQSKKATDAALKSASTINNSFEITDEEQISEALKNNTDMPQVLVLKRTGIRIFPDGRRVALYVNEKMGLVFTVPYKNGITPDSLPGVQAEETETVNEECLEEATIDQLKKIHASGKAANVKFSNGEQISVNHQIAGIVHQLHSKLNPENQAKISRMISNSPKQFNKIVDFAVSKSEFNINKK